MFSSKCTLFMQLAKQFTATRQICCSVTRCTATKPLTKFYKRATITESGGKFEINLDKRKLKTPGQAVFEVPNETLAMAVAQEWNSQEDTIKRHTMHLNLLCNTAIDNPTRRPRDVVINHILEFLDTDTICYRAEEPEELAVFQKNEWDPLIDWLEERYKVRVEPTQTIAPPHIPEETREVFRKHLRSFNDWALVGYQHAVDILKSLMITMSLVDRKISVEKAVYLARLEQEFQIQRWGNVEWYHDIDLLEQRARLAAAVMFIHLNSMDSTTMFNKSDADRPV